MKKFITTHPYIFTACVLAFIALAVYIYNRFFSISDQAAAGSTRAGTYWIPPGGRSLPSGPGVGPGGPRPGSGGPAGRVGSGGAGGKR